MLVVSLMLLAQLGAIGCQLPPQDPKPQAEQPSIDMRLYGDLWKAYGFCLGQDTSLDRITKQYAQLSPRVELARAKFDAAFGPARKHVKEQLIQMSGDQWNALEEAMRKDVRGRIEGIPFSEEDATAFLATVDDRTKGKAEPPFLEILLSQHPSYVRQPAQEFLDGFKRPYESKGNPKAKGVHVKMAVPLSWIQSEAERPNIVQKFKSQAGRGSDEVMLVIINLPYPATKQWDAEELKREFSPEALPSMAPKGARVLDTGTVTIDGQPGGRIAFEQVAENMGVSILLCGEMYATAFGNHLIMIQMHTGGPASDKDKLQARFKQLAPARALIVNSVVLMDRYAK